MKKKLAIRRKRSLLTSTALYHIKDWKQKCRIVGIRSMLTEH